MNRIKVASRLLKLARHLVSMEFDTDEEMKKYKQEHDVRPGTKLTVKKTEGGKISIPEKNKPTNKTEHRKTDDAFWNSPKKSTMDIGSDAVTVDKQVYPDGSFSVHPTVQNGRYGIDNTMREMQFDKSDEKTVRDLLNEHLAGGETMGGLYVPKFESVINLRNKLKKLDISHLYQES